MGASQARHCGKNPERVGTLSFFIGRYLYRPLDECDILRIHESRSIRNPTPLPAVAPAIGRHRLVALSKEQYQALAQAIENWRQVEQILGRMQSLTRQIIFGTLPDIRRRKHLTKKVLGVI
jgi:hypothetical protein